MQSAQQDFIVLKPNIIKDLLKLINYRKFY